MMFNLRDFIKKGLLDAVGKMADYQVILNASGWLEKGVLDENDLAEIDEAITFYKAESNLEVSESEVIVDNEIIEE